MCTCAAKVMDVISTNVLAFSYSKITRFRLSFVDPEICKNFWLKVVKTRKKEG
jgi:hypothetical protein